jgi:hypothetical protein
MFFQTAWPIIEHDIVVAFNAFWSLYHRNLYLLNQAYIVLLRKKKDEVEVKEYRPISLIHNINKLFTKDLSL